jgi:hypothetical protein
MGHAHQSGTGSVPNHIIAKQSASNRRFAAAAAFGLLAVVNGYTWLMFEPIELTVLEAYQPYATPHQTALLGSWQPAIYVLLFIPMTRMLLKPNGLTLCMRIGVAAELIAVTLKLVSVSPWAGGTSTALYLVNFAQMLSAVSSPVSIGAPSQLSAEWFRPAERTRATAVGVLANNVGNAIVYLVIPLLAATFGGRGVAARHGLLSIILLEAVLAVATAVLVMVVMPVYSAAQLQVPAGGFEVSLSMTAHTVSASSLPHSGVQIPDNESAEGHRGSGGDVDLDEVKPVHDYEASLSSTEDISRPMVDAARGDGGDGGDDDADNATAVASGGADNGEGDLPPAKYGMQSQLRYFVGTANALLIFCIYAWTSGAFIAWTALFDHLLLALRLPFTEQFIGSLSLASTVGYVLGGVASSYLADRYFPTKMKLIIVMCCFMNTGVTYLYSESLPLKEAYHAINAAEEAIALGAVFKMRPSSNFYGSTADLLLDDQSRSTTLNATAAQLHAQERYSKLLTHFRVTHGIHGEEGDGDGGGVHPWLPVRHHGVYWPEHGAPVPEQKQYQKLRSKTFTLALDDAIRADRALEDALPRPQVLQGYSFIGGFFNGASAPLFYELIAEVTFPFVGEAVSGNLMSVGENLGALLMFQGVAVIVPTRFVNKAFVLGMAICSIGALFMKEDYARRRAFEKLVKHRRDHKADRRLQKQRVNERAALLHHAKPDDTPLVAPRRAGIVPSYGATDAS